MHTEGFERWFNVANLTNPISEWNKITIEMTKRLTEQNMQMIHENITTNLENTQKIIRLAIENMEEMTKLCSSNTTKITNNAEKKIRKYAAKKRK